MQYDDYIYLAYINNEVFAVSSKKKRVKNYMENIRHCKKKTYEIRSEYHDDDLWRGAYHDVLLVPYNDIYLCNRDISILESDIKDIESVVENTYRGMKFITPLFELSDSINHASKGFGKKVSGYINSASKQMESFIQQDEFYKALERSIMLSSVIFSDNLSDYYRRVKKEAEKIQLREEFLDKIYNERE